MELTPEELILEDIKEWVTKHILVHQTWDEYMNTLESKEYSKKLSEFMEIYWQDHIFPIDKY